MKDVGINFFINIKRIKKGFGLYFEITKYKNKVIYINNYFIHFLFFSLCISVGGKKE
jgi:hypothetical protein